MAHETDAVWFHAGHRVTIVELAECSGLPEAVVRELIDYGALAPVDPAAPQPDFSARCVASVRTAVRLANDLELETPALALVISFLERIDELESRLREMQAKLPR
jgi:chaperone modulatory protein CbpM